MRSPYQGSAGRSAEEERRLWPAWNRPWTLKTAAPGRAKKGEKSDE